MSIRLAQKLNTEIISADSRQFYREMNIGTAKPAAAELASIPHHFINTLSVHDRFTVGDFENKAIETLDRLFESHDHVIMCGGSGLFIRAVCEGLDKFPEVSAEIIKNLQFRYENEGLLPLAEELSKVDPAYSQQADLQNPRRVMRALSVFLASGQPFSSFQTAELAPRIFQPIYYCLELPREILYERINQRVLEMMTSGLLDEAISLFPFRHLPALQTVGYQELFDYIENKYSLDEAVALIQQHSRNYAKRQITWFKKYGNWKFIHPDEIIRN